MERTESTIQNALDRMKPAGWYVSVHEEPEMLKFQLTIGNLFFVHEQELAWVAWGLNQEWADKIVSMAIMELRTKVEEHLESVETCPLCGRKNGAANQGRGAPRVSRDLPSVWEEEMIFELPTLNVHTLRKSALIQALRTQKGHVDKVARALGVGRMTVYRWMREFHLDPKEYR